MFVTIINNSFITKVLPAKTLLFLIPLFIASCFSPQIKHLEKDNFDYRDFRKSECYIVRTVNRTGDKTFSNASDRIKEILVSRYHHTNTHDPSEFRQILKLDNKESVLSDIVSKYRNNNLNENDFSEFSKYFSNGYIILSTMSSYKIEHNESQVDQIRTLNTKSTLKGSLSIYCITNGKRVYYCEHEVSKTRGTAGPIKLDNKEEPSAVDTFIAGIAAATADYPDPYDPNLLMYSLMDTMLNFATE
jgi:hypothetical protein